MDEMNLKGATLVFHYCGEELQRPRAASLRAVCVRFWWRDEIHWGSKLFL